MQLFSFNKLSGKEKKSFLLAVFCCLICLALDQLTKYWVVKTIVFQSRITVIPGFFDLTYITNTGAAWGILSGRYWILLLISGLVFVSALFYLKSLVSGWIERYYAVFLILSGILGNCADRIFRGAVVDFLSFYIGRYAWPSFNVADSCICIGVGIFILSSLLRPEHPASDPDSPDYVHLKK